MPDVTKRLRSSSREEVFDIDRVRALTSASIGDSEPGSETRLRRVMWVGRIAVGIACVTLVVIVLLG